MLISRGRIPLLAGGAAVLLLAGILIELRSGPAGSAGAHAVSPPNARISSTATIRKSAPRHSPPLRQLPDLPAPVEPPHASGSTENQNWITQRISELDDLAWYDDPESLGKILTELRSPLLEIRTAALSATRAFGSRDAIPYLEAISLETKDPLEQKAIAELIEHLNLPTILEKSDWNGLE